MSRSGGVGPSSNGNQNYRITSGNWFYPTSQNTFSTALAVQGFMPLQQFYLPPISLSGIAAEVTTAGTAGSLLRLGLFADNGSGQPGNLLLDAGTIDGTVVAVSTIALGAATVWGGGYVWGGTAQQGAPVTASTMRTTGGPPLGAPVQQGGVPAAGQVLYGYILTGIVGALPANGAAAGASVFLPSRLIFKAT